ncbi:MAG: DUF3658 domain-containing protein [Pseudoflavonifractor sp.]|nr:DUF3658 domain-containing protein [Pseudoflavonifractor sp.]
MIEIVFSDSACGSLKVAQHCDRGKYQGGCISVIVSHSDGSKPTKEEIEAAHREAEEKERLAWETAIPLGGNPSDIYGFGLALNAGDISEKEPGDKRAKTLEHLFSIYPKNVSDQLSQQILKKAGENLNAVRGRAKAGESLRIWYSNQPDELCGLYWLMDQFTQWEIHDNQASMVKLPDWETDDAGKIMQKSGWGEVAPEEWHRYLSLETSIPAAFRQGCAFNWQMLQGENAPLRAVLNGQLVSMPEALYDGFILREIAAEGDEFQEAKVVGRVLGKYRLGIGDAWVALRIEEMIRAGELKAVSAAAEDMPIYHRLLKKCTHGI